MVVDYRVEFGVVGEVGRIHSVYYDDTKQYIIDTNVSAVGFIAKSITHNLKERHICKGYLSKNGLKVATSYEMIKSYGKYRSITRYTVNHQTKKVRKSFKKWLKRKGKPERKIADYSYDLKYYARNDMITLFLNLGSYIKNKNKPYDYIFKAVGADRMNGKVDIHIPSKKEAKKMEKLLDKPKEDEWLMNLVMHRQLYHSRQGELMVHMAKDSTIKKAVLKDLIFFGDVRIIRE
jgi:dsDNA-binding SOS-regulon protein